MKNSPQFRMKLDDRPKFQLALLLLALLVSIYSLTYSGTFVTDDEHILASRSLSLAFDDNLNDGRVYGNSRVYALAGLPSEQAEQALNIEPGEEFFGALLARLSLLIHTGRIQTIFLLNIWSTALTALVLFGALLALGYSASTGLVVSLLFGLSTIVWPYARTYFRDPLAMLFLMVAWACAKIIIAQKAALRKKRIAWLAWTILVLSFLAGIFTKNTVVVALPVILLELAVNARSNAAARFSLRMAFARSWKKVAFILTIIFVGLAIWLIVLPNERLLSRFTLDYYRFVTNFFINSPHPNFWAAVAGPFVSPGKSIFLFSPVLVLSLLSFTHNPKPGWSAWAYLLLLAVAQALFYDKDWWGHINWGLRFTLPAIPPLMLASAPLVERWLKSVGGRIGLAVVATISALVQLVGVLPPLREYYISLSNIIPAVSEFAAIWNPKYSALLWQLKWILAGSPLDLATIRMGLSVLPVAAGFGVVILLVFLGFTRFAPRWLPWLTSALSIGLMVLMLFAYRNDPAYYLQRVDLEFAQAQITEQFLPDDLVLIKSYGTPAWYYWMNWTGPRPNWVSLPFYFPTPSLIEQFQTTHDPAIALDEITLALLNRLPGPYRRVWIVLPGDSPGADLNIELAWLESHATVNDSWTFSGDETQTRLYLFEFPPNAR